MHKNLKGAFTMRRILVPLDGTDLAAAILPDAARLAGPGGIIVLIRDVLSDVADIDRTAEQEETPVEEAERYLAGLAGALCAQGYTVETQVFVMDGPVQAIEEAIRLFTPDMVACATHGRAGISRLLHGSVTWQALSHSTVPMLLRHVDGHEVPDESERRFILVPLDGSKLAEAALPLAEQLALEWDADLLLARVVPWSYSLAADSHGQEVREAQAYLESIPAYRYEGLPGHVRSVRLCVLTGVPIDALAALIADRNVTDLILASHGRTGLSRLTAGSVTDGLIHRVHCPAIVVPAWAAAAAPPEPAVLSAVH
jgi:nucleotide-binding universal stress UspA family protein